MYTPTFLQSVFNPVAIALNNVYCKVTSASSEATTPISWVRNHDYATSFSKCAHHNRKSGDGARPIPINRNKKTAKPEFHRDWQHPLSLSGSSSLGVSSHTRAGCELPTPSASSSNLASPDSSADASALVLSNLARRSSKIKLASLSMSSAATLSLLARHADSSATFILDAHASLIHPQYVLVLTNVPVGGVGGFCEYRGTSSSSLARDRLTSPFPELTPTAKQVRRRLHCRPLSAPCIRKRRWVGRWPSRC